jgi:hypothetical protein
MRAIFLHLLVTFSFSFGSVLIRAADANPKRAETNAAVKLYWAIGGYAAKSGQYIAITNDTKLHSGDEIKMAVKLMQPGHLYLLHEDSTGSIHSLLRTPTPKGDSPKLDSWQYIPAGPPWFKLDDKAGREKIVIVVSKTRLPQLEAALQKLEAASDRDKRAVSDALSSELRRLRRETLKLDGVADRVTTVGGTLRGNDLGSTTRPDVSQFAMEVFSPSVFCKTITIDHLP